MRWEGLRTTRGRPGDRARPPRAGHTEILHLVTTCARPALGLAGVYGNRVLRAPRDQQTQTASVLELLMALQEGTARGDSGERGGRWRDCSGKRVCPPVFPPSLSTQTRIGTCTLQMPLSFSVTRERKLSAGARDLTAGTERMLITHGPCVKLKLLPPHVWF